MIAGAGACLDEDAWMELLERPGAPAALAATEAHVDGCAPCRELLAWLIRLYPPRVESSQIPAPAPESELFLAGDRVAGRYRIVRFIARGGMGEVYEAEDLELEARVALKTVRAELSQSARAVDRFKREIALARQVTHPNVCRIFDVGFEEQPGRGKIAFLTMELVAGETLADHMARVGKLALLSARPIILQMVEALNAAHRAGVVHRDFKSANVMLAPGQPAPRVVVTDFGLARSLDAGPHMSDSLATAGTPAYLAPEQVEGREATPAVDVYALGVVMYEMATGRLPFVGDSPLAVALQRLKSDPPSPRGVTPDCDSTWQAVIMRCLARNPKERFSHVRDVVDALSGQALPRTRRRPVAVAMALLAITAALAAWLRSAHVGDPARPARPAPPAHGPTATPAVATAPALRPVPEVAGPAPDVETVEVVLSAIPRKARWFLDGDALGCNPCTLRRGPASHHIAVARAPGYRDAKREIAFGRAHQELVSLAPLVRTAKPQTKPSESPVKSPLDTENPYQ